MFRAAVLLTTSLLLLFLAPRTAQCDPPSTIHLLCPVLQSLRTDQHGDPLPAGALARCGTIRLRHEGAVLHVVHSPDGRLLASLGQEGTLRLWDSQTGRPNQIIREKGFRPKALAFSADSKVLAVGYRCSGDEDLLLIQLREVSSGKVLHAWTAPEMSVSALALLSDQRAVIGLCEEHLYWWDTRTGVQLRKWQLPYTGGIGAISPDAKVLAYVGTREENQRVHLYDLQTGVELHTLKGHQQTVISLAFSADGKFLASGNPFESVRVWDVASGNELRKIAADGAGIALRFSADGRKLAGASMNGRITLWDLQRGGRRELTGYVGWVNSLAFSPNGQTLALAGSDSQQIECWEIATAKKTGPWPSDGAEAAQVMFTCQGRVLLSLGKKRNPDGLVLRRWDPATGQRLPPLTGEANQRPAALAVSPRGDILVLACAHRPAPILVDATTGMERHACEIPRPAIGTSAIPTQRVAFSPDGNCVAAVLPTSEVGLWQAGTGHWLGSLLVSHGQVSSLAFAPDSRVLLTAVDDGTIRLWDVAGREEIKRLHLPSIGIPSLSISADGKLLAATCGNQVYLWQLPAGRLLERLTVSTEPVQVVQFSPDGRMLATAGQDGVVRLYEVTTRRLRLSLAGHTAAVIGLAFSPHGRRIASASADTTLLVWDVRGAGAADAEPTFLTTDDLEQLWQQLTSDDAALAYKAVWRLAAHPDEAGPFLQRRLLMDQVSALEQAQQWILDLGHDHYARREQAMQKLLAMGRQAEPCLRDAWVEFLPEEAQRRIELLLERLDLALPPPAQVQALRAAEALDWIVHRRPTDSVWDQLSMRARNP
jgi:WD40 repeat protein